LTANKTTITDNEVKKVAQLARLHIAEEHLQQYAENFSKVLDLITQIREKDTTDVTPMFSSFSQAPTPLREDKVNDISPSISTLVQANAPLTESSLYLVPEVIE
jgi:aspartyl-tRNA(Asn)/glutamyl-tRNA(Gln) amidotransferase subunit C